MYVSVGSTRVFSLSVSVSSSQEGERFYLSRCREETRASISLLVCSMDARLYTDFDFSNLSPLSSEYVDIFPPM